MSTEATKVMSATCSGPARRRSLRWSMWPTYANPQWQDSMAGAAGDTVLAGRQGRE